MLLGKVKHLLAHYLIQINIRMAGVHQGIIIIYKLIIKHSFKQIKLKKCVFMFIKRII